MDRKQILNEIEKIGKAVVREPKYRDVVEPLRFAYAFAREWNFDESKNCLNTAVDALGNTGLVVFVQISDILDMMEPHNTVVGNSFNGRCELCANHDMLMYLVVEPNGQQSKRCRRHVETV